MSLGNALKILVFTVMATLAAQAAFAACAPPKLVHIVTTEITPSLDPTAFDRLPKNFFREGDNHLRLEEQQDDANKVHGLAVISEPNIWMANLYDRTGRHIVDPNPRAVTTAAVFPDDRISSRILDLEFGCEAAFVSANAPKVERTETVAGVPFAVHKFIDGKAAVEILLKAGDPGPAFARYYRDDKIVWELRYDLYEVGSVADSDMFTAPKGVKYVETQLKVSP